MLPIDIIFLAFCVYIPILTALYIVQVWVVFQPGSKFRGPFYRLFVASAVCDILFIVMSFPEFRWAIFPISNGGGMVADWFAAVRIYLSFVCPVTQDFLNCFTAINRLTAITIPIKYGQIWKKVLPVSIAFSYVFSLIFFAPLLFRRVNYATVPMGDYVIYLGHMERLILPWFSTQLFCVVLELIINFVTLICYARASMLMKKVKDKKLLIIGIILFAMNIPGLILQSLMGFSVFSPSITTILYYNLAWVADVKSFSAPITMLIVNDSFRKETIRTLRFWSRDKTSPSMSSTEG